MGKNKAGRIVSKRGALRGKNVWIVAVNKARCSEDQGFLRGQRAPRSTRRRRSSWPEHHVSLPLADGAPALGCGELPAACLSAGRERRRWVRTRIGPQMSCTPMEKK